MSEEKPQGVVAGTLSGWLKAALTSVVGLVSGAVLMYLTPVINTVIKPAKPVANFSTQIADLTVTINNRSTGGMQGWWDFGDGTALDPFDPKVDNVKHVFAKPGIYTIKLALQNLIGEESDRTVQITLDANSSPVPEVEFFKLSAITPPESTPAVYRLEGKVKNAGYCVLSVGDNRPLEILDNAASQERYITFSEMGSYTVRFAAVNGKRVAEKTETVFINPNEDGQTIAKLFVSYDAVKVERSTKEWKIYCGWKGEADAATSPVRRERLADPGCTIVSAELINAEDANDAARSFQIQIAPDRKKAVLSGELARATGLLTPKTVPPHWVARVKVVQERRSAPQTLDWGDVTMAVNLNSTTKIPMQPLADGWEILRKKVSLELWDSGRKAWEGNKTVTSAKVMLKNQTCLVTATPQSDSFLLKIDTVGAAPALLPTIAPPPMPIAMPTDPVGPVIRRTGFERNPLLPKRP